jgi:thymidylate kinase
VIRPSEINGVLIEGTDFSGKTTIARIVNGYLTGSVLRRCFLTEHPLVMFIDREARRYDDLETRDKFYTSALLMDLILLPDHRPEAFVVQDRHWLSQVGRNLFFHRYKTDFPVDEIVANHIPFRYNFYLSSDMASRQYRASCRKPNSPRDSLLAANPDIHQRFDEFHLSLLPQQESWHVLDNSSLSAEQTAREIISTIEFSQKRSVSR